MASRRPEASVAPCARAPGARATNDAMRRKPRCRLGRVAASRRTPGRRDQLTADDHLPGSINAVYLKDRLGDVETDCRNRLHNWLLRFVGALTAPTSMALTCRWRSRPQHQLQTLPRRYSITSSARNTIDGGTV